MSLGGGTASWGKAGITPYLIPQKPCFCGYCLLEEKKECKDSRKAEHKAIQKGNVVKTHLLPLQRTLSL